MNIRATTQHRATRAIRRTGIMLATLGLAGCASTGGLHTHAHITDSRTIRASGSLKAVPLSAAAWPTHAWWTDFGDDQLNRLIDNALHGQPRLRMAEARVRAAEGMAGIAGAPLYPQVHARASSERERFSEHGTVPPPMAGTWQTINSASLGVDYELDFWGGNRATMNAALDRVHATQVDLQAARLMLGVAMVQTYLRLDSAYALRDLVRATLAQRQKTLALTRARVAAQVDSRVELTQAEAGLPAPRERLQAIGGTIALLRNQIAALEGKGPDAGLTLQRPHLAIRGPVRIPSNLPVDLIGRRPDVVAQRWRVEAARQDIKAARAKFYPDISLNAFVGLQRLGFSQFLSAGSRMLGVGPAISLPLFEGGRLRGNLALHQAGYDAAVERYNATVLAAVHDVVDQLTALAWIDRQQREQARAIELSQRARDLAAARYRKGLANDLQVLAAEGQVLARKRRQIQLDAHRRELRVELIRALGGGYIPVAPTSRADASLSQVNGASP
ncbi:MAG TPA: efflux transporter outer membrane subunit [Rhodanobacteraceae bacterium]|nr:efflux transporter outer membrane subunit [Rhodanobacteraceae bacterium]